MTVIVIDTETTGPDPEDARAVEVAGVDLDGNWMQSLVRPGAPISWGAMATHLITQEEADAAPALGEVWSTDPYRGLSLSHARTLVAHNADFDSRVLSGVVGLGVSWICTYRCAMTLMPDAESHRNIALCLEAGLDIMDAPRVPGDDKANMPHRALFDAWATRKLLLYLMSVVREEMTTVSGHDVIEPSDRDVLAELMHITREPMLLRKVWFGKHRDELWKDLPRSYLRWVLTQDFDRDVRHTARYWLDHRVEEMRNG